MLIEKVPDKTLGLGLIQGPLDECYVDTVIPGGPADELGVLQPGE